MWDNSGWIACDAPKIDFPVHATKSRPPRRVNRESACNAGRGYFAPPILNIFVPQIPHFPSVAGRPFFMVICTASFISRLLLHFTQYASNGVDIDSSVISRNPAESPADYSQGAGRLLVSVPHATRREPPPSPLAAAIRRRERRAWNSRTLATFPEKRSLLCAQPSRRHGSRGCTRSAP